ncbi:uncharacterized protein [Miscanthus floridulus]|uniref:uncharacterized protein n=1 Tax=Miscanthus floridulus TaxID=154761 RepID=UPI0034597C99
MASSNPIQLSKLFKYMHVSSGYASGYQHPWQVGNPVGLSAVAHRAHRQLRASPFTKRTSDLVSCLAYALPYGLRRHRPPAASRRISDHNCSVMKRNEDIASLFQKHAAKKKTVAATATSNPDPIEPVVEEQIHERVVEEIRRDMLRNARLENVKKALDCGEIKSGTGLHQEIGLPRPGDTRWGSHYKTVCSIITMYEAIHDVLVDLGDDPAYKDDWTKIHFVTGAFENFEFVFFAHLMYIILGYTNELSEYLQRRDQDILNAISLVNVAKKRMQKLRSDGWNNFLENVTLFCDKHGVEVPAMDGYYVPYGKSARKARAQKQTNDDHFRREVYIGVIDQISQELDNRFDKINMELLSCMSAFSPSKSFASFDAQKLRRLAEFYPKEFSNNNLLKLELQLDNYIDDMRHDDSFKGLDNIVDLSAKLVETKRHKVYDMVYELLKLILLLHVATASVERVFSAMVFVKTKLRNKIEDSLLDDCLVIFIERDIFFEVDEYDIINIFMSLRKRRIK